MCMQVSCNPWRHKAPIILLYVIPTMAFQGICFVIGHFLTFYLLIILSDIFSGSLFRICSGCLFGIRSAYIPTVYIWQKYFDSLSTGWPLRFPPLSLFCLSSFFHYFLRGVPCIALLTPELSMGSFLLKQASVRSTCRSLFAM